MVMKYQNKDEINKKLLPDLFGNRRPGLRKHCVASRSRKQREFSEGGGFVVVFVFRLGGLHHHPPNSDGSPGGHLLIHSHGRSGASLPLNAGRNPDFVRR